MSTSYESLVKDIKNKKTASVYLLHGEEGFYSDRLIELFEDYLPEEEKAFNLFTLYAPEKDPDDIMDIARRYPLMSSRIVIIVKETQSVRGGAGKWINRLAPYASNPSPTTILVIVSRGTKVACKEFTDATKKGGGIVFESTKIKDFQAAESIRSLIGSMGLKYESSAVDMLAENIGADLSKLYNELLKLKMILPQGATITPESIEKNIGISREFNNYELTRALSLRDGVKALKIIRYFNSNQRDNPWVLTLSTIFNLFANALIGYYTEKNDTALGQALGTSYSRTLNECKTTMKNYSPSQIIEILGLIRKADAFAKGNGSRQETGEIMENLILQILMATGKID